MLYPLKFNSKVTGETGFTIQYAVLIVILALRITQPALIPGANEGFFKGVDESNTLNLTPSVILQVVSLCQHAGNGSEVEKLKLYKVYDVG
jgi:hypothetical protein